MKTRLAKRQIEEMLALVEVDPDQQDIHDGLVYQFKEEFYPATLEEMQEELVRVATKYHRVIEGRKEWVEEITGRQIRIRLPRRKFNIKETVLQRVLGT